MTVTARGLMGCSLLSREGVHYVRNVILMSTSCMMWFKLSKEKNCYHRTSHRTVHRLPFIRSGTISATENNE